MQNAIEYEIPLVPVRYARMLLSYLGRQAPTGPKGVGQPFHEKLGFIVLEQDSGGYLTINQTRQFLESLKLLMSHELDAFRFGQTVGLGCLGVLGYVATTRDSMREIIIKVSRLVNESFPLINLKTTSDEYRAELELSSPWELGAAHSVLVWISLGCIYHLCRHSCKTLTIELDEHYALFLSQLREVAPGALWCSGGEGVRVTLNGLIEKSLDYQAQAGKLLPLDRKRVTSESVKAIIEGDPGKMNMERCAEKLQLSARSLRTRLANESVTFREIKAQVLKKQARLYLRDSNLSIARIARILGYADQASFTRSFKAMYGMTPGDLRQSK